VAKVAKNTIIIPLYLCDFISLLQHTFELYFAQKRVPISHEFKGSIPLPEVH
jgi:hypothetical protein